MPTLQAHSLITPQHSLFFPQKTKPWLARVRALSLQTVEKTGTQGSHAVSNDNDTECTKSDAEHILGGAETTFTNVLTISIAS